MKRFIKFSLLFVCATLFTYGQIQLRWTDINHPDEVSGWNVYQAIGTNNLIFTKVGNTTNKNWQFNNLTNLIYNWRVTTVGDTGGESPPSETLIWFPLTTNRGFIPVSPTNLIAQATSLFDGNFENGSAGWLANGNVFFYTNTANASVGAGYTSFNSGQTPANGTLTKTITNVLSSGKYQLVFDLAAWAPNSAIVREQKINVQIIGLTSLANQTYSAKSLAVQPWFKYTTHILSFVPDSKNITIKFTDVSNEHLNLDMWLDNVKMIFADN